MAETVRIEVQGVKQTLRVLRSIDPQLRKQFNKDAREVVKPLMDEAKRRYTRVPLSGFRRSWDYNGREITPRTIGRYRSGVTFEVNTSDKRESTFTVIQRNAAASIFDMAGRRGPNELSRSFERAGWGTASRVMWPAAEAKGNEVIAALIDLVEKVAERLDQEMSV